MKLIDNPNKVCKCGHAAWYHNGYLGRCTFKGCNCYRYIDSKPSPAFLGGFTYTEDEICKCHHGWWNHLTPRGIKVGKCRRIMTKNKNPKKTLEVGKCIFIKCKCKKFLSKIKVKKLKEVKR